MASLPKGDPAESPRASQPADFSTIEARELLSAAVQTFPGNLPMVKVAFESLVLAVCGEAVAQAIDDAGSGGRARNPVEVITMVISEVQTFANPWLAFRCIPIVFRLGDGELDQTRLAAEFGVTKGDVSAICVKLEERFGLPPGHGMKSAKARRNYAHRQEGKRARPRPQRWPYRGLFQIQTA